MSTSVSGSASYKKKDGKVVLKEHTLEWTEVGSMQPAMSIVLSAIKNLQASPATAASASMRVFAAPSINAEPVAHTFKFTLPNAARQEMDMFVSAMQIAITAKKSAAQKAPPKPSVNEILASQDVETDADLQEALLKSNAELANTFREAVINGSVTPAQFWSSRTHLLRAFLVERSQSKGPYNVLATIRPKTVDNKITVNMTREKIRDVFTQHPLLRRIYDETVPPLGEDEFWSRFFVSRLCKKLRGERILPSDPIDDQLDKYINIEADEARKRAHEHEDEYVPNVINLEGNEEHNSKRMGNAPDFTMRPSKTAVINSINSISMGMLDSLAPKTNGTDKAVHNQDYENEFYQQEIRLGDLQVESEDARIILNIKDQRDFFEADRESGIKATSDSVEPEKIVKYAQGALPLRSSSFSLVTLLDNQAQVDSTADTIRSDIMLQAHRQTNATPKDAFTPTIYNQLVMSHSASQEFLALFWSNFLSGDFNKAKALAKMAESLRKTNERVEAIASKASKEESEKVRLAMRPTLAAVNKALAEYDRAVKLANTAG
ncbi:RNA polymerase II transcription factor B subunit 1 [Taphrina deformans PYCC 5710]|uniref:RNA polymerase II transcription factor B subunit 1 n=1 Tax=Taphrina deformans (strain PYCC 5710 / ATCC 11124 / CBS 356.35 / IMI 108563 / JCM 9778 / NBRC 8474) TaxID=1097556 RepID=R4XBS4_TAPDE|nr:RNA polymerase II transcription factor B subunit 1 [Taphrina deformans PYCC 5710]|eukprot:CCG83315.1 RNA polymerase II transcription factor B subunit 1 [Taphrina deformans PYCC 5710]